MDFVNVNDENVMAIDDDYDSLVVDNHRIRKLQSYIVGDNIHPSENQRSDVYQRTVLQLTFACG